MNKLAAAKTALHVAASVGAGTIVYTLVRNNVVPANMIQKITVPVATFALGGAVAKVASTHMDEAFDEIVKAVNDTIAEINKNK